MLPLNKKTAKKLVHKHFFSTFEALINRRVSNTALTQQAIEKDELRYNPICKLFGSRVHNATTLNRDQARRRRDTRKNNHIERAKA